MFTILRMCNQMYISKMCRCCSLDRKVTVPIKLEYRLVSVAVIFIDNFPNSKEE